MKPDRKPAPLLCRIAHWWISGAYTVSRCAFGLYWRRKKCRKCENNVRRGQLYIDFGDGGAPQEFNGVVEYDTLLPDMPKKK